MAELPAPKQLVSLLARRGQASAVAAKALEVFGVALPLQPAAIFSAGMGFLWCGPGQWLTMSATDSLETTLREHLGALASVCDQSGSRVLFELQGPAARKVLAKGLGVDLHPRSFTPGMAAVSSIGHMGVQFWQVDAAPTYRLLVARSYAESFRHWLQAANNGY